VGKFSESRRQTKWRKKEKSTSIFKQCKISLRVHGSLYQDFSISTKSDIQSGFFDRKSAGRMKNRGSSQPVAPEL
jgi:hypothetical protein